MGLTLNPKIFAFEAFANVTSVSVTGPTADKIIFGLIFSTSIFMNAAVIASKDPCTSAFTTAFIVSPFDTFPKISSLSLVLFKFF